MIPGSGLSTSNAGHPASDARLLLDIDNVICDFETAYRELINSLTGRRARKEEIYDYSFARSLGLTPEEEALVWTRFNETKGWANLQVMPGAAEFSRAIRELAPVMIVTNRPESIVEITREWLVRHKICFDDLYVTEKTSKRDYLAEKGIRPRLVFEDAWHHAVEFAEAGVPVILFDCPWNRRGDPEGVTRVGGFDEALSAARKIFTR